eukprot:TRINITY_DN10194_c0_g1_i1.p1 TRINITY_DN10194_c0_g1~~TRINITY_DN10194_c0_g1_i1.p1  ORF type:complete len:229 (+),score=44.48 TRINITY_DN10194_c0_g1_i1:31-687(+)
MFVVIILCLAFFGPAFGQDGNVRIIHSIADGPSVDIYADDVKILAGLEYPNVTNYMKMVGKFYTVEARIAGTSQSVATSKFALVDEYFTLALLGSENDTKSFRFAHHVDDFTAPLPNTAQLHFGNFLANTVDVNVLFNNTGLFSDVLYGTTSYYINVAPGIYSMTILDTQSGKEYITNASANVTSNNIYSIIVVGNADLQSADAVEDFITLDYTYPSV